MNTLSFQFVVVAALCLVCMSGCHARRTDAGVEAVLGESIGLVERERVATKLTPIDTSTATQTADQRSGRFWKVLAGYKPPQWIVNKATGFGYFIQDIFGSWTGLLNPTLLAGLVGLDYYPLRVTKLPDGKTVEQLFQDIRVELMKGEHSTVIDTGNTQFSGYNADHQRTWDSTSPNGAIIHLDMYVFGANAEDATVITSSYSTGPDSGQWIFTTMKTKLNGEHPVSGNREFGYFKNSDGSFTIYTKGADRMTSFGKWIGQVVLGAFGSVPFAYKAQTELWQSFQTKVSAYINNAGGQAAPEPYVCKTVDWNTHSTSFYQTYFAKCYIHNGGRYQLGSGNCKRTTTLSCGVDSECQSDSSNACSGRCVCGDNNINECKCVNGPIVNDINTPKLCNQYDTDNL